MPAPNLTCDVLVIGGGIAGTMAAWAAASAGARTVLACAGALFSGSSFYPGTWGLGLVAPEDEADEAELADTICAVGCGVADRALVESFVAGIRPAIAELEGLGVVLKRPENADDRTFIPCFDHKRRTWRGITRTSYEEAVGAALGRAGVTVRAHRELMDLAEEGGRVAGALLYNRDARAFEQVRCGAVVLATGGYGGLFTRRLTAADVLGSAQAVAAEHGCDLVNLEFMQIMPAFVAPPQAYGTVFNEKTWRYAQLVGEDDRNALADAATAAGIALPALMEARSMHGPFSARLPGRLVDLAIDAAGDTGLAVRYPGGLAGGDLPEFVRAFSAWLAAEKHVGPDDELRVAEFAHAANGGIRIDAHGATGLPGLFACGECTGGMHGADRLGGLSSANGLVFGLRAGRGVAAWARREGAAAADGTGAAALGALRGKVGCARRDAADPGNPPAAGALPALQDAARDIAAALQRTMSAHCLVRRTAAGLSQALAVIDELEARRAALAAQGTSPAHADAGSGAGSPGQAVAAGACGWEPYAAGAQAELLAQLRRLQLQLALARRIVQAALDRPESCGSHYRADAPSPA